MTIILNFKLAADTEDELFSGLWQCRERLKDPNCREGHLLNIRSLAQLCFQHDAPRPDPEDVIRWKYTSDTEHHVLRLSAVAQNLSALRECLDHAQRLRTYGEMRGHFGAGWTLLHADLLRPLEED